MAGQIPIGVIANLEEDVLPTTAPHLDVRVKKGGKYINPMTARTVLQNVQVGKDKTPLFRQDQGQFTPSFTITSPYGPRKAPTAGASTFHKGIDIGIPAGTQLAYKGYGTYTPGEGLGRLQTQVNGDPYELEFLHIKPGKQAKVDQPQAAANPFMPEFISPTAAFPSQDSESRARDVLKAFIYGTQLGGGREQEKPQKSFQQQLKEQIVGGILNQAMNPMGFLQQYSSQDPYLMGRRTSNQDYFDQFFS
jgi:hypothetical protein